MVSLWITDDDKNNAYCDKIIASVSSAALGTLPVIEPDAITSSAHVGLHRLTKKGSGALFWHVKLLFSLLVPVWGAWKVENNLSWRWYRKHKWLLTSPANYRHAGVFRNVTCLYCFDALFTIVVLVFAYVTFVRVDTCRKQKLNSSSVGKREWSLPWNIEAKSTVINNIWTLAELAIVDR